ncbi:hypothetical protein [Chitinophaga niabensis]|uniref:Uncharacterized protein n=1 Tax=Chitinophaga niabensis TaxID=536979 RepID=A0A1N6KGA9_9BACT|nr:hypothetical protein [Chitinophaga niabensis]SIO55601.1 hypothetical protein SAMN04488055_5792 [Chitinophaga niabensis]
MKKIKFSLIASAILVVSSFVPIIQVLILTANGAFLSLFTSSDTKIILLINGIAFLLMLVLFYFAKTTAAKVFSIFGFLLFFLPLFFYSTGDLFIDETGNLRLENLYFLQFLLAGIAAGVLLTVIELMKAKAPKYM